MNTRQQYSGFLEQLAAALDITPTQYEEAKNRYEAVGNWLGAEGSPLEKLNPVIYPQGSFRLGTVIKPITDEDQYDIDLVCKLDTSKEEVTQKELKNLVGDRLKANDDYEMMLDEEGRRSWTLVYAESTRFHMDIIPAIDDDFLWLIQAGVPAENAQYAICITDKESNTYLFYSDDWPKSNPVGYAEWFKDRMKIQLHEQKRVLAERLSANIEEIQDYKVKTPLQRAVQILKRHRDIMFGDDDDKPISIIITTLAARAYSEEASLYNALVNIIDNMPKHIKTVEGQKVVENPVNPAENFADKWIEHSQRQHNFYKWIAKAKIDLTHALIYGDIKQIADNLRNAFGEKLVNRALNNYLKSTASNAANPADVIQKRKADLLAIASQSKVKPWCK